VAERIKDKGGIRTQFHHVIDIAPTILEAARVEQPSQVNGVAQKPIEGVSTVYSFDDAKAQEQRHTQYFEMFGNRAVYHDGWVAAVLTILTCDVWTLRLAARVLISFCCRAMAASSSCTLRCSLRNSFSSMAFND
jgi:arylsulfatase A-like enzyme